jgi:hypothetical protein
MRWERHVAGRQTGTNVHKFSGEKLKETDYLEDIGTERMYYTLIARMCVCVCVCVCMNWIFVAQTSGGIL